jgi:hypothetical protein
MEEDEDEHETSALEDTHRRSKADQTVRFEEHVQSYSTAAAVHYGEPRSRYVYTMISIGFRVARLSLFIDVGQPLRGCVRNFHRI